MSAFQKSIDDLVDLKLILVRQSNLKNQSPDQV